ncbi:MAG: hypothetical protein NTV97_22815 [Alphaproteobacteria bacterium]|nr:hypothetical protein [Alphaproteobacteria bacterium]
MVRVTGLFSSEDIEIHDSTVLSFLAREGEVRGIYDLSAVETVAVPASKAVQRGQAPSIIATRVVVVAPHSAGMDFVRIVREQQRLAGHREPILVETLEEAYLALELADPRFEPVEAR